MVLIIFYVSDSTDMEDGNDYIPGEQDASGDYDDEEIPASLRLTSSGRSHFSMMLIYLFA